MRFSHVFQGTHYRVQLVVYDFSQFTDEEYRRRPPHFHVTALNQRYPKGTSYARAGIGVYSGGTLEDAWKEVKSWAMDENLTLPPRLEPYLKETQ